MGEGRRMALHPVTRRSVPDQVFDQLLDEVIDGGLSPGDTLPGERTLAQTLGVSRPAVREALQRMSASRLVDVRQGGTTTVRDLQRVGGLDLLPRLLVRGGELDPRIARSILDARLALGPVVAALAAARRTDSDLATVDAALDTLEQAPDAVARQRAALDFWDAVTDAADSLVFRLLFNNLRLAYEPAIEALGPLMEAEVANTRAYAALVTAIRAGSQARARRRAHDLLEPATDALTALIDDLEGDR
jgi:GntR family transcriptional regulator, transcriptional repressor for pyruvate dehydrogenase complex